MALGLVGSLLFALQAAQAVPPGAATVRGEVRESRAGAPLAGAIVALPDLRRSTATGPDGRYALAAVPAGPQHLEVRAIGHSGRTLHALVPADGGLELNVALDPLPVRLRAIEVRRRAPTGRFAPDADGGHPDRVVSGSLLDRHPFLAEPDALVALGGGAVALRPEAPAGLHVRGGAADHVAYRLDGVPVFSPYHTAGLFAALNPDALAGVRLDATAPDVGGPDALSGEVAAATRAPGSRLAVRGGVSSTQARLTVDGPVGAGGAGYLLSLRAAFPGALAPGEAAYLRGAGADRLLRLDVPVLGGALRLLGYDNENELSVAAQVRADGDPDPGAAPPQRHTLEWRGASVGAMWRRAVGGWEVAAGAWHAEGNAGAAWLAPSGRLTMASRRNDAGLAAGVRRGAVSAGLRVERRHTAYNVAREAVTAVARGTTATLATVHAGYTGSLGEAVTVQAGAALAGYEGRRRLSPRARLAWRPWPALTLSLGVARLNQFAQSLRNPESVAGTIFPADLHVGAGSRGVPIATADQAVGALELRLSAGVRVGVQGWTRRLGDLVLVAPRSGEPFAVAGFAVGGARTRGLAIEAGIGGARLSALATYAWQSVRAFSSDTSFVPEHGVAHVLETGLNVFPTATATLRLGVVAMAGRRATAAAGSFEWEACNLADRGCEFGGAPSHAGERLGGLALPAYLRVDLGARKHWHATLLGRSVEVAVFGTITNVLGRANQLTLVREPGTGELGAAKMRPRAPLVVGLDWRF